MNITNIFYITSGKVCLSGIVKSGRVSLENLSKGMYIINVKGRTIK